MKFNQVPSRTKPKVGKPIILKILASTQVLGEMHSDGEFWGASWSPSNGFVQMQYIPMTYIEGWRYL